MTYKIVWITYKVDMEIFQIGNFRFLRISRMPNIIVSLRGVQCFSILDVEERERFMRKNFGVKGYRDFNQVHGTAIFQETHDPTLNYDGFVVSENNFAYGLKTADCVPLISWNDDLTNLMGLHCGWKGLSKRIIEKSFGKFSGFNLCNTYMGPHISKKFFEVKEDLIEKFSKQGENLQSFLSSADGVIKLDITRLCLDKISKINAKNMVQQSLCSYANSELFYSWRRDQEKDRRNITITWL